jgi:hypothetical protein
MDQEIVSSMGRQVVLRAAALALLVACGPLLAQTVEADRLGRRCTGATLDTDPAAPCPDDVLRDNTAPRVVRPGTGPFAPSTPVSPVSPLPGTPVTSGGVTPGTSGSVTAQTLPGTPATSAGAAPGTPGSVSTQVAPGRTAVSGGTTPGR